MDIGIIIAGVFWISYVLSTCLAAWGVWHADRWILFASALISIPFAFVIVAHPATRYFAALPVFHLVAGIAVKGFPRWMGWLLFVMILALAIWFFIVRFG